MKHLTKGNTSMKDFDYNIQLSGNETFEELNDMIQKMNDIDPDLEYSIYENNKIFGVLQRMHSLHARKLEKLTSQYDKVKLDRWRRLAGKWTVERYKEEPMPETVLKSDIDKYVNTDDLVIEMKLLLTEQDRVVKLIEDAQKAWTGRSYTIKTLIDYQKYKAGA